MDIKKATEKNVDWIDDVIRTEFPYTGFSVHDIAHKLSDDNYLVLCAFERSKPIGFIEFQFFSHDSISRLSAVFVEERYRRKGIAEKLAKKAFFECRKKEINHLFLLVKESNTVAKKFYKKIGFSFEKMHEKIIEGSNVEVWLRSI